MGNEELTSILLNKMEIIIIQGRENAIQLATMHGKLEEKEKNCERQNERLEAAFSKADKLDERLTKVEAIQAWVAGEKINQNRTDSVFIQWVAIIVALVAGGISWLKN